MCYRITNLCIQIPVNCKSVETKELLSIALISTISIEYVTKSTTCQKNAAFFAAIECFFSNFAPKMNLSLSQ